MPIQIIDGFKLGASKPIDDRIVASGSTARFAIPNKYDGLLVVDTKDRKPYIWNADSGTWSSISIGSNGVPGSVTTSTNNTYVGNTDNVYIGGNSTTKNVYIGDTTNKSDLNVSNNLNVTGVISGNGSNITNINPSNLSTNPGQANQVLQLVSKDNKLIPTWSTITTGGSNITAKVADTTSNYYIGFIDNTSGAVSNIYTVSGIGATNGVLYSKGLSASIGTFTGLSASIGTFSRISATGLSASVGTFSSLFVNFFNTIGLSASVGTFSYAFATGLSASVGTFSRVFATGLSASVGTFSRVFATGLSASVGTFSYAFATGLSASVGTFSRVIATFSSSLDLSVNRSATFSGNGRILAISGNGLNSLSSIEIYKTNTSNPVASIGYYEPTNNNFIIKNSFTSASQSIVLTTSDGININTNVSSKYGVIITNSGKNNSYGLNVQSTFTSTQLTAVHNCIIARFDSSDGTATKFQTSTFITRHGLYVQGDSTSNSGAVDKPSIAFNGSPTTGFYSDSPNKIGISSNGVEKMSINTDGVSMISRMLNYWIVPIMSYGEGYTSLFLNPKDAGNTNSAISASNYGTPPSTSQISTNISNIVFPAATYDRIIYFYGGNGYRQLSVSLYLQVNSSDKEGAADIFKSPPGPALGTTITSQDSTPLWMGGSALQLKNYIGDSDSNNIFRCISRTYTGTSISSNFIIPANKKFIITISLYVTSGGDSTKLQFSLFKFGK